MLPPSPRPNDPGKFRMRAGSDHRPDRAAAKKGREDTGDETKNACTSRSPFAAGASTFRHRKTHRGQQHSWSPAPSPTAISHSPLSKLRTTTPCDRTNWRRPEYPSKTRGPTSLRVRALKTGCGRPETTEGFRALLLTNSSAYTWPWPRSVRRLQSTITETLFETRYLQAIEMIRMGRMFRLTAAAAIVTVPHNWLGRLWQAFRSRASASLVPKKTALVANGDTTIEQSFIT